ncbi:MAG: TlpA family protein disulfide reductase [Verrucomicrobiota bacterium]|nr:TlpA family protein disulfide reductase [Verrucomicrobiota bacterium]
MTEKKHVSIGKCAAAGLASALMFPAFSAFAAGTTAAAAQAWQGLIHFSLSPPPESWQSNMPTDAQLAAFDQERAAESAALADRAADFYKKFPADTNAASARILEIQALQASVHLGDTNRLGELMSREELLIHNANEPREVRYEVAVDLAGRRMKMQAAAGANVTAALEKAGRALLKEFPDGPSGYELLSDAAEESDLAKMRELGGLMASSGGPAGLTDIGRGLLRRVAVVGKRLPIHFMASNGSSVNLTTLSNQVVLVDFWATWCPHCVQAAPEIKKLYDEYHGRGFQVIGINFDDDTNQALRFIRERDLPWPEYLGGQTNEYGADYGVDLLPEGWLVDRRGIVQDIHATVNMKAKVEKLLKLPSGS